MRWDWRDALLDALALVLPVECVGCGAPDRELCGRCAVRLAAEPVRRTLADGTPVWSGLAYDGVARAALLAAKEHGRTGLLRRLAPALRAAVDAAGLEGVTLCTIPTSPAARRRRGGDPVASLARLAGLATAELLSTTARTAQKRLGIEERARNRAGAFRVAADVTGRRVLLLDDVVTTGATLGAAAAALRAHGATVSGAATVAATPRRYGRPGTLPADPSAIGRDFRRSRD